MGRVGDEDEEQGSDIGGGLGFWFLGFLGFLGFWKTAG